MTRGDTGAERRARLADVRVPRYWQIAVVGALLLAWHQARRDHRELELIGEELGTITIERWRDTDARAGRLIRLTSSSPG